MRKGRKVTKHGVFPMICGSGGSTSRLAKAAGAEPAGQMRDEKLRAHFEVKMYKAHHVRATFGRSDVLSRGRRKGLCTLSKVSKNVRVLWHFQKRWQAWDI